MVEVTPWYQGSDRVYSGRITGGQRQEVHPSALRGITNPSGPFSETDKATLITAPLMATETILTVNQSPTATRNQLWFLNGAIWGTQSAGLFGTETWDMDARLRWCSWHAYDQMFNRSIAKSAILSESSDWFAANYGGPDVTIVGYEVEGMDPAFNYFTDWDGRPKGVCSDRKLTVSQYIDFSQWNDDRDGPATDDADTLTATEILLAPASMVGNFGEYLVENKQGHAASTDVWEYTPISASDFDGLPLDEFDQLALPASIHADEVEEYDVDALFVDDDYAWSLIPKYSQYAASDRDTYAYRGIVLATVPRALLTGRYGHDWTFLTSSGGMDFMRQASILGTFTFEYTWTPPRIRYFYEPAVVPNLQGAPDDDRRLFW